MASATARTNAVPVRVIVERQYLAIDVVAIGADELLDEVVVHGNSRKLPWFDSILAERRNWRFSIST
jgi:hypothetical protein